MADLTGITDIQAWALYSDLEQTGEITTANEKVNRLYLNSVWSQRDNFLDVPTDCPQRDERMGWTGDAQAFCPTANYNMDCGAFYTKYIRDLLEEQKGLDGKVPMSPAAHQSASWRSKTQCSQTAAVTAAGQTPQPSSLRKPTLQRATSACSKTALRA